MTPTDAATLLTMAAAFDNRTPSEIAARAWSKALNDVVNVADAEQVIVDHYAKTRDWIMPSDINQGVAAIRRNRTSRIETPQPPASIDGDDVARSIEWQRAFARGVGDGLEESAAFDNACAAVGVTRPAIEATTRPVAALVEQLARTTATPRVTGSDEGANNA